MKLASEIRFPPSTLGRKWPGRPCGLQAPGNVAGRLACLLVILLLGAVTGCYTPLHSPAVPASSLPDVYRMPTRSCAPPVNLASVSTLPETDYVLGTNDVIEVTGSDPYRAEQVVTFRGRVMDNGEVNLPVAGGVFVAGLNLARAQDAINRVYWDYIKSAAYSVSLVEKGTVPIPVLGEVVKPGVYPLPRNENAVAHALAYAGGLTPYSADYVEIHRVMPAERSPAGPPAARPDGRTGHRPYGARFASHGPGGSVLTSPPPPAGVGQQQTAILRIPLRGSSPTMMVCENQPVYGSHVTGRVELRPGDVVVVPRKEDEVFFVVGPLSEMNVVNFTVTDRDRQLGSGFIIPKDRDIDVVTAVAMAGYIDPIYSPSTVTVHRSQPGCPPLLVRVDLMKARYSWQENIYVQPGDIIYLNPDPAWWWRRTFDRVLPELLTAPYREAMGRWINPWSG